MKLFFTLFFIFCSISTYAQNADVLVINASNLSLKVTVEDVNTTETLSTSENIGNLETTGRISVPTITILTVKVINAATNFTIFNIDNIVFEEGELRIINISQSGNSTQASSVTLNNTNPVISTIRGVYYHLGDMTDNVDVALDDGLVLAEDLGFRELSSIFSINTSSNSNTVIVKSELTGEPISAFEWDYSDALFGQWVYLFAQGNDNGLDMYSVDLSDGNLVELNQAWSTAIEDIPQTKLTLFPNPSTDFIQLTLEDKEPTAYHIYSSDGKLVQTSNELNANKISVKDLTVGEYIIKVETKDQEFIVEKFLKQ